MSAHWPTQHHQSPTQHITETATTLIHTPPQLTVHTQQLTPAEFMVEFMVDIQHSDHTIKQCRLYKYFKPRADVPPF